MNKKTLEELTNELREGIENIKSMKFDVEERILQKKSIEEIVIGAIPVAIEKAIKQNLEASNSPLQKIICKSINNNKSSLEKLVTDSINATISNFSFIDGITDVIIGKLANVIIKTDERILEGLSRSLIENSTLRNRIHNAVQHEIEEFLNKKENK